ncbi:MAG TPA: hypothetical protein VGG06_01155 [Thermoanaerobaculia bacterium]|jgi:hypothetical protein
MNAQLPLRLLIAAVLAAALLGGCSEAPPATDAAAAPPTAAPPPAAPPPAGAPAAGAAGTALTVPGGTFTLPAGWTPEQPSSQMRLAQAAIPGPAGPGELTVFYFGPGGGGGLEANLQRWIDQVDLDEEPLRDSFTLGTWKVTWIDAVGTLKPSTMGTGPDKPQPGSRLLGAVVEGEGGPWFFKATGPAATLDAQRDAFLDMLKSGRPSA